MRSLKTIESAIRGSWDADTCYPVQKRNWKNNVPELGQCAVTALLLQEYLGGDIAFNQANDHFWNILPNGKTIDLTRTQFRNPIDLTVDALCNRHELLYSSEARKQETLHRYELLKHRVENKLNKKGALSASRNKEIAIQRHPKRTLAL
jgi:hypothetical protein